MAAYLQSILEPLKAMNHTILICFTLLFALAVVRPMQVRGDYYAYTDANGTPVITNKLETVPRQYRGRMRVVKEEKPASVRKDGGAVTNKPAAVPAASQPVVREEPAAAPEPPAPPAPARRMAGYVGRVPWLKPLGIGAGLLAGFLVVARLASHLSSPQLARVIYLAFFLGVFVFAYKSYAESMVQRYFAVKTRIITMFRKANVRQAEELVAPPLPARREGEGEGE